MDDNMEDNTTRILKLANGESIVCTCIPTRIDEGSPTLHVIHPLKMELKNKVTKKGIVEALTLSRWLQPFTESDELDIEKSTIITVAPASYALNNYYNFMLSTYNEAEAEMVGKDFEPSIQPSFPEDVAEEDKGGGVNIRDSFETSTKQSATTRTKILLSTIEREGFFS